MTTRPMELTEAQQGVLAAQLIDPASPAFTVGEAIHLQAQPGVVLDDDRLRSAIDRATAEATGMWLDLSADPAGAGAQLREPAPQVGLVDLTGTADPAAAVQEQLATARARAFDLTQFPLHEQTLLRVADQRRTWIFRAHHVILDGYAIHQVIRRALLLYAATTPVPEATYAQPEDVIEEERRYLAGSTFERDRAAWAELTSGNHAPARVLSAAGAGGSVVRHRTTSPLTGPQLDAAASSLGVSWADVVTTAVVVHLARRYDDGPADVVLGLPLMNRLGSAAARCPTMVTNVLPLRVTVDPSQDVAAQAKQVAAAAAQVKRHGRYRAERLQRDLGLLVSGQPLTLAELNLKVFETPVQIPGVTVTIDNLAEGPQDDISFTVERARDGAISWLASGPAGASAHEVRGHLEGVGGVLAEIVRGPGSTRVGDLRAVCHTPIHGPDLDSWPDPGERFAEVVAAHPHRLALVDGADALTYQGLGERVAVEAGRLRAAGVGAADLVAIDLPRGTAYVVAILALHRLGAVAVPLDAEWPLARRQAMLDRLGTPLALSTLSADADEPIEHSEPVWDLTPVPPLALAYVIHTSGSTGFPKAVGITRAGLGHFVAHHEQHGLFADAPADRALRVGQTLPMAFDGSWDTLQGLLLGHAVWLVDRDIARDPAALTDLLATHRIDLIDTMPSLVAALLDEGLLDGTRPAPSRISVGGEACSPALWQRLRSAPGLRVLNLYGPTEFTVDALGASGEDTDQAVIGRPLAGTTALVLDQHLQAVPHGVRGELYLAGVQEARGYLGQPGLTAERFVANPFGPPGGRMYRTGDVVSVGPDGLVNYHGRRDAQAKIRGFRVEPAEVEAALAGLPGVSSAAVVVTDERLVGYVVPAPGADLSSDAVRAELAEVLPGHLVPAQVSILAALPVTTTGKIDVASLPRPGVVTTTGRPPSGPTEEAVAAALAEVIPGLDQVAAESDFFAVGGDSISAIRTVAALRRAGWISSVRDIFQLRTVAGVASGITRAGATDLPAAPGEPPQSLVELDQTQLGQLDDLLARRTRRSGKAS